MESEPPDGQAPKPLPELLSLRGRAHGLGRARDTDTLGRQNMPSFVPVHLTASRSKLLENVTWSQLPEKLERSTRKMGPHR